MICIKPSDQEQKMDENTLVGWGGGLFGDGISHRGLSQEKGDDNVL
jgi:hypothetical protein